MKSKLQMIQLKLSPHRFSGSLAVFAALLCVAFNACIADAATEPVAVDPAKQAAEFDMEGYTPDQTEWSEKAKRNYAKTKNDGGPPLAWLTIERLNLAAPVYFGTDRVTLDRGLGSVDGTARPGEVGNIGISGHRDGFFRPLKNIKPGDVIEMKTSAGVQAFAVSDISIVDALEVSVLDPTDTTILTLITCHPFYYQGYAPDRYIVRATPVGNDASRGQPGSTPRAIKAATSRIQLSGS